MSSSVQHSSSSSGGVPPAPASAAPQAPAPAKPATAHITAVVPTPPKGVPNPNVNYAQRFNDYKERFEKATSNQKAHKEALAKSSSKQIKLQDEIDYLLDALASARAARQAALGPNATGQLGPAPGARLRGSSKPLPGSGTPVAGAAAGARATPPTAASGPAPGAGAAKASTSSAAIAAANRKRRRDEPSTSATRSEGPQDEMEIDEIEDDVVSTGQQQGAASKRVKLE